MMHCNKRAAVSEELLNYKVKAKDVGEPKYHFSPENFIPCKRKWFARHAGANINKKKSQSFMTKGTSIAVLNDTLSSISEESFPSTFESIEEEQSGSNDGSVGATFQVPRNPCEFIKLGDLPTYLSLLVQENGASICNYNFSAFVLQDFDSARGKLIQNRYVFVQRHGLQFIDAVKFVYWCCCDPETASIISTLHSHVNQSESDFHFPSCIHIQAITKLLSSVKDILPDDLIFDPLMPIIEASSVHDHIFPLHDGLTVCVYLWPCDFSVVSSNASKEIVCYTCSVNKKGCEHVTLLHSMKQNEYPSCLDKIFAQIESSESLGNRIVSSRVSPSGVSKSKISFKPDSCTSEILRQGGIHHCFSRSIKQADITLKSTVESDKCPSCQNHWTFLNHQLPLVTEVTTLDVQVEMMVCTTCNQAVPYDGVQDALINMTTCLVSHDLLHSYLHSFLNGRFPMYAFHKVLLAKHEDSRDIRFPSLFPYYVFRASWYHFLELLDIDYEEAFKCPLCSEEPTVIICDATSLAFRRDLLHLNSSDKASSKISSDIILDGCQIEDRVFIPNSKCRTLVAKYAKTAWDNTALVSFGDTEAEELNQLVSLYSPSISSLLKSWNYIVPCPSKYACLLSSLAIASPVCALLPPTPNNLNLMDKLISGYNVRSDPILWALLQKSIPIVFRLIVSLDTTHIPDELKPVLTEVVNKSKRPFEVVKPEEDIAALDLDDSCSFYPHLTRKRSRRVYRADLSRKQSTCSKVYKGHPSLLPGIFTAFCPHGICIGFEVMSCRESPNIPFTLFKTRFSKAPTLVIYDNACSLHTYCLLRDPHRFKDTRFLVDRFHWSNHTGCSLGYQLDSYPELAHLNSEVNEQANSNLSKLKSQLSYMSQKNFMDHCKLFIWYRNRLKLEKLKLL